MSVRRKLFDQLEVIQVDDTRATRALRRVRELLNPILRSPIVNSRIIEDVQLVNGVARISHGLGRRARGFFVMVETAGAMSGIYNAQSDNPTPDRTIWVGSSAATTAALLVY